MKIAATILSILLILVGAVWYSTGYQRDRRQCDDRSEPVGDVRLHHHRHRAHPPGIHQPEKDLSRLNYGLCQAFIIFHVPHFLLVGQP